MRKAAALGLLAALTLAACNAPPVKTDKTTNEKVPVELLFTHEGCSVYRFRDGYRDHYYTTCQGSTTSGHSEPCGKSCFRRVEEEIPTEVRP